MACLVVDGSIAWGEEASGEEGQDFKVREEVAGEEVRSAMLY